MTDRVTDGKLKTESRKQIVIAPYGSLGDLHPFLALANELRARGHEVRICSMEGYRERIGLLGFEFYPLRPGVDPDDREFIRESMDLKRGTERIIKDMMFGNLMPMFDDLMEACDGFDVLISGEIVYAAESVAEIKKIDWITASLAPISFMSAHDPSIFPVGQQLRHLRFLGVGFQKLVLAAIKAKVRGWYPAFRKFRSDLGLSPDRDPIFDDKYSGLLHLAMFSKVLGRPQPDWHRPTLQCGFCFYDGQQDLGVMPAGLEDFLRNGEPPIVFTLGSAAVMDAGDFFDESIKAAKILNRRAVMLYGITNEPPQGLDEMRAGFDYAPFSRLFPQAACVVHSGGVGTTAQALRAGVPQLIMPYSHDQPDNADRCERLGVARVISRRKYSAKTAVREIQKLLADADCQKKAAEAGKYVQAETGTRTACDAIEVVLKLGGAKAPDNSCSGFDAGGLWER